MERLAFSWICSLGQICDVGMDRVYGWNACEYTRGESGTVIQWLIETSVKTLGNIGRL
jgi:hypothetical protein